MECDGLGTSNIYLLKYLVNYTPADHLETTCPYNRRARQSAMPRAPFFP
jgi:hypothetical protein